jgi:hypothetical protein
MVEIDDDILLGLVFHTDKFVEAELTGARSRPLLEIRPSHRKWTFRILAAFLNERSHQWIVKDSLRLYESKQHVTYYIFVCGRSGMTPHQNLHVKLFPHQEKGKLKIYVEADRTWVIGEWVSHYTLEWTQIGSHGRSLAQPKQKQFVEYSFSLPGFEILRPTSQEMLTDRAVTVTDSDCLSACFRAFVAQARALPLPHGWETDFLHDVADALHPPPARPTANTLEQLGEHLHGHLQLSIMNAQPGDPFPVMIDRQSRTLLSIIKGCYVTPYAHVLFTQNAELIDGLLLDATFKMIRSAVASIMNVCICNVGVPLALAFGPIEDMELYETFHRVFIDLFHVDLGRYHVVSDQGRALQAICNRHNNQQFFCLRHLLLILKRKRFSEEVGQLVRCRVPDDYQRLCALYQPIFRTAEGTDARLLSHTLAKVGLAFEAGEIRQSNPTRWAAVSMMSRVPYRLPSTSNALESTHGHANECTPRRNEFLPSLLRVGAMMCRKTLSFRQALKHNFRSMVAKARRRAELMDSDVMDGEIAQYQTTLESCRCGETIHLSVMYRTPCPCSHQYALGAEKPHPPDIDLMLTGATSELIIAIERIERAGSPCPTHGLREQWERTAAEHIQRFSHATRKKAEIQAYVHGHFEIAGGFAMGFPISLYKLISEGIQHFSA